MRNYLIIFCFLLTNIAFSKDKSVEISYTHNYLSNNLNFCFVKKVNSKNEFRIGLKYHLNNNQYINHDASGRFYYQFGYNNNFLQGFGLNGTYSHLFKNYGSLSPFIFFDIELSNLNTKFRTYNYIGSDSSGFKYFQQDYVGQKAFLSLQNNLGLGTKIEINPKTYLRFMVGIGVFYPFGKNQYYTSKIDGSSYYFTKAGLSSFSEKYEIIGFEGTPFIRIGIGKNF